VTGNGIMRSHNVRFLVSLLVPAVVFLGWLGLVSFVVSRAGIAVGLISGTCFILGLLIAYWHVADLLSLRAIRRPRRKSEFRDGDVVAFDGVMRADGEPVRSPFTARPCAAFTYKISASKGASSPSHHSLFVIAQGFHKLKCRIVNGAESLSICNLPGFEDDLRENVHGDTWLNEARAWIDEIAPTAASAGEGEREGALLEARRGDAEEVHRDYCMTTDLGNGASLVVEEEVLPVDRHVCVVGTYDAERGGLTARKRRWGHNLVVYEGTPQEVVSRISKESRFFTIAAAILLGVGISGIALAILRSS